MEVITTHVNADFDCLGAMIAAKRLYPEAELVFAGGQERNLRQFFLASAVYAYDFKSIRDIDLSAIDRLILVDVRQASRIGPFGEVARRPGVEVHIYDHHPSGDADLRGAVEVIEPVGATVTVFSHIFMEKGVELSPFDATLMMLGLYEDTGSLQFHSTTVRDYQAAAFLLSQGASLNTVADFLIQELTPAQVALLHELIESRIVLNIGGVDVSVASASVDHFVGDLAVLAHKLKDMEGLDALIVAVRMEDRIFLVGRSRIPEVHVGEILAEFGGGGHGFAASGTVRDLTLVQILDRLSRVLAEHVNPRPCARHLMSFPVKSAPASATIAEVRRILTRYNFTALPVLDGESVVGVISRQVVEKAAHHGLSQVPVSEYMSSEFDSVESETPVEDLQEMIVERNQRFVPVIEAGRLVGAVTRTDLLRHMVAGARSVRRPVEAGEALSRGMTLKKRQVERLLRSQLPAEILALLHDLGSVADTLGVDIFLVGGLVRDLLLHQENLDLDIVVEGDGIAFAKEYARAHRCRVRTHEKFGTAVLVLPDGFKVDVASARMEYYLEPGALPTVEHASIKLDLYRRDFTINTLAIALNGDDYGELLDFFGGQRDLKEEAIRVLHNLSFVEDPTRVFRAIRFEQRLGFRIGPHTENLLRSAVRMGFLSRVGGQRVLNELVIILKEARPFRAVSRMSELDLLKYIHPALALTRDTGDLFEAADRVLHWYDLLYTDEPCRGWIVYFLCLTSALDQDAMKGITGRLDIPSRYRKPLTAERADAYLVLKEFEGSRTGRSPAELYRMLHPFSMETILYLMAASSEPVRRSISHFVTHLRSVKSRLTGHDLAALGIPHGPIFREILTHLLDARLDGKVLSREDEIALVRESFLEET